MKGGGLLYNMQGIKETIECVRCGCIALPDATKCPKCGAHYYESHEGNKAKEIINAIDYISNSGIEDIDTRVIRASYQFICPHHGRVSVKAVVIAPKIKCPFCP